MLKLAVALSLGALSLIEERSAAGAEAPIDITIDGGKPGAIINRHVLGRGIHEGMRVGPDSPIPNTRGIRNDVVAALEARDARREQGGQCRHVRFPERRHTETPVGMRIRWQSDTAALARVGDRSRPGVIA